VPFESVVNGISAALQDAGQEFDISARLIMCFLRHLDQQDAFDTLKMADLHQDKIVGVGLDSSELGHPPEKFEQVFARARSRGYRCVAHAGEEGPPEYIWSALDRLKVDRIDHGNNALRDNRLVDRLVADAMPLTVCPLSNVKLCVVDEMINHPLKKMLELGLNVSVNSDDPSYFGGYINANFRAVTEALDLDRSALMQLAKNSITASFLEPERQQKLLKELAHYGALPVGKS
jgi:adenosine deaminase